MARNLFSVPIFFIVFRETLEAAIIISVLLGLVEQIVHEDSQRLSSGSTSVAVEQSDNKHTVAVSIIPITPTLPTTEITREEVGDHTTLQKKRLIRKLRFQVRCL